jgi:phosphopantothenoylcysteine decarboxylase / phosphopantothenate---cysteine ligase
MPGKISKKLPRILVTAGPTREYLDPVRFLSNPSSGKMGSVLASAARGLGNNVTLCLGPVPAIKAPGVRIKRFGSSLELRRMVLRELVRHDILIMAAAVSDYRPKRYNRIKMKKAGLSMTLDLTRNPDILTEASRRFRGRRKLLVGFAAETNRLEAYARRKLKEKNIPLIIANRVYRDDKGFSSDLNDVLIFRRGTREPVARLKGRKVAIAKKILRLVLKEYDNLLHQKTRS